MVLKLCLNQWSSLLPLSLLVLTNSLNVGSVKAQAVGELESLNVETFKPCSEDVGRLESGKVETLEDNPNVPTCKPSNVLTPLGDLTPTKPDSDSIQTSVRNLAPEDSNVQTFKTVNNKVDIAQAPNPVPLPTPLQTPRSSQNLPTVQPPTPDRIEPPSQAPLEPQTPAPLPPPERLLESPPSIPPTPQAVPGKVPETITVRRFEFEGNTAISDEELAEVTAPFTNRPISFAELFQVRSAVTDLYLKRGYITSGSLIPPQTLEGGVVTIQVVEGGLEGINVTGTRRLNPDYVRSRIAIATSKPLNRDRLLEALQLLQLNPLIQNLSAELSAGTEPGLSLLEVRVTEAKTFNTQVSADNNRSPSVGTFRRRVQLNEANLLGLGDGISVSYTNTDGSNGVDFSYTLPINARNGTLRFSYGYTSSHVIEPPFDQLDINSDSRYYEVTWRQPIVQTPTQEFALGVTGSRQESKTTFLEGLQLGFPSPGADDEGRTRISALRFFQEWTQRNSREVIAARSQFSVGIDVLDATLHQQAPDSRFFSWRGQAQWVRLLAPDTLLLVRGDVQLADRPLVPLEQFGLGGQESVRGYRQDILLTDSGALASAEVRIPILRLPQQRILVQVAPFVDIGTAWNSFGRPDPDPSFLASTGLGLQLQVSDRLTVRLDYGIPLVSAVSSERTWQENGFYFSIVGNLF
jgi:hemolysin activation/secretion protein